MSSHLNIFSLYERAMLLRDCLILKFKNALVVSLVFAINLKGYCSSDTTTNYSDSITQIVFQKSVDSLSSVINDYNFLSHKVKVINSQIDSLQTYLNDGKRSVETLESRVDNVFFDFCALDSLEKQKGLQFRKIELKNNYAKLFELEKSMHEKEHIELPRAREELSNSLRNLEVIEQSFTKATEYLDNILSADSIGNFYSVTFNKVVYRVFWVGLDSFDVQIIDNSSGVQQPLSYTWNKFKKAGVEPFMIMNAGMYKENGLAQGLLIEKNKIKAHTDSSTKKQYGNFYLYPNGVFFIDSLNRPFIEETQSFIAHYGANTINKIRYATQSGPMLVRAGKLNKELNYGSSSYNIRNGVGVKGIGKLSKIAFVITEKPVNFHDFAVFFKDILGCKDALYLDGAVSKMYVKYKKQSFGELTGHLGPTIVLLPKSK